MGTGVSKALFVQLVKTWFWWGVGVGFGSAVAFHLIVTAPRLAVGPLTLPSDFATLRRTGPNPLPNGAREWLNTVTPHLI